MQGSLPRFSQLCMGLALDDHGARRQVHFFAVVQLHPQFARQADGVIHRIGLVPALGDAGIVLGQAEYAATGEAGAQFPGVRIFFSHFRGQFLGGPHRNVAETRTHRDRFDDAVHFDAGFAFFVDAGDDSAEFHDCYSLQYVAGLKKRRRPWGAGCY